MPMKVTVCFDKLKVLVPCGDGEILVRELIEKAITRYKKAIGKSTDYWVSVHYLRTGDDSILDPDDTLNDVVDDREQLTADFEEQGGPRVPHNGDGQSVSSTGTASPDIFQTEFHNNNNNIVTGNKNHFRGFSLDGGNDVIVTATELSSGSGLTVRRGSEPALNVLEDSQEPLLNGSHHSDGWKVQEKNEANSSKDDTHKPIIKGGPAPGAKEREKTPPFSRFARDSWRQSLGNQPNMFKWLEAHERQEDKYHKKSPPERQAPVGGSTSQDGHEGEITPVDNAPKPPVPVPARPKEVGIILCLTNDGTPLGIHVIPDFDQDGRESGLLVQGIEKEGRIFQDGRLKIQDRIIEINGCDLHGITFPKAQEIFRNAMKTEEVRMKVVKHSVPPLPKKPPPAVLPKPRGHSPVKPSPLTLPQQNLDLPSSPQTSPEQTSTPQEHTPNSARDTAPGSQPAVQSGNQPAVSHKKRAPPAPPVRSASTTLSSNPDDSQKKPNADDNSEDNRSQSGTLTKKREALIAPTNTKKIGKKVELDLVKGPMGLGFSVTTRDNTTVGPSPIYIKNILPKGAAVTDGRLKAGDRLLEVDGVEMTGKTQTEAVGFLRNVALGSTVHIVVSRHEVEEDEQFSLPRELSTANSDSLEILHHSPDHHRHHHSFQPPERAGDDGTLAVMKNKEIIELNIPLNDTESAGLGVSVKGKTITTEEGTRDLGIFVKAVISGGAASKDGRLLVNDQLLEVNDASLINMPNVEAMELLRNAMQDEGPFSGHINLKIARKIGVTSPSPFSSPEGQVFEFYDKVKPGEENNNIPLDNSDHVTKGGLVSPLRQKGGGAFTDFKSPNMFLDRIMAGNGLRNESYTKATHESYAETPEPVRRKSNLVDLSKQKPRPHSTLGLERVSPGSASSSSDEGGKEPAWIHGPDWHRHPSQTSEESQLSPTGADGFSRDGFGRQSMSEKRKGHNDPRSSEVYQRAKGLKDVPKGLQHSVQQSGSYGRLVRAGSADSLMSRSNSNINSSFNARVARDKLNTSRNSGVHSNLKRFSSLENLSTMKDDANADADVSVSSQDDETSPQPRIGRRRGGNESFRAAVDRSYDPVPRIDMDPQQPEEKPHRMQRSLSVEEESSEGGSLGRDPGNSARSSVSDTFNDPKGKKKGDKKGKDPRRSGGKLKGLFKFGFGRKTPVDDIGKAPGDKAEDRGKDSTDSLDFNHRDHVDQQQQLWQHAQGDQDRAQEQYRRMQEQHFLEQQRLRTQQMNQHNPQPHQQLSQQHSQPHPQQAFNPFPYKPPEPHSMGLSAPVIGTRDFDKDHPLSRAEKIQQLRMDHQRRHQERHGHYPHDDREEEYEKQIQEDEKKKYGQSAIPSQLDEQRGQGQVPRPGSRNQIERPGSRVGPSDTVAQGTSNYADYSELPPQQGTRHVSDSNINRYTYNRPPSRGDVPPDYSHHYPPGQYHPNQPTVVQRGPTPTNDHWTQPTARIARGPTPNHDQDRNLNYPVNTIYQPTHRGNTPTNENYYSGDPHRRGYASQSNMRYGDHVTRQDGAAPPGGGNFNGSSTNYRDPVYTAMAGKRPVKALSSQPNSAKV